MQGPLPLSGVPVGKVIPSSLHHLIEKYLSATGHTTVPIYPSSLQTGEQLWPV